MPPWIYLSINIYLLILNSKLVTITKHLKAIIYTLSVNTHAIL